MSAVDFQELEKLTEFCEKRRIRRIRVGDIALEREPDVFPFGPEVGLSQFKEETEASSEWDDWCHTDGRPRRKDGSE